MSGEENWHRSSEAVTGDGLEPRSRSARMGLGGSDVNPGLSTGSVPDPAPENWWSTLVFGTTTQLLNRGFEHPLELRDITPLADDMRSDSVERGFDRAWNRSPRAHEGANPPLHWVMFSFLWKENFLSGVLMLLTDAASLSVFFSLQQTLQSLGEGDPSHSALWVLALVIGSIVRSLASAHQFFLTRRIAVRLKASLFGAVHRKLLRMPAQVSKGVVTALVSNDVVRISAFAGRVGAMPSHVVVMVAAMGLLGNLLGWAALPAIGVALACIPLNIWNGRLFAKYDAAMVQHQGSRLQVLTEALRGMMVVKLFSWEDAMESLVKKSRLQESEAVRQFLRCIVRLMSVAWTSSTLMAVASFSTLAVVQPEALESHTVLSAMLLFEILKMPLLLLPEEISDGANAMVSLRRLQAFFDADEVRGRLLPPPDVAADAAAIIRNATFSWHKPLVLPSGSPAEEEEEVDERRLGSLPDTGANDGERSGLLAGEDVEAGLEADSSHGSHVFRAEDLRIQRGELVAVIGTVGAGKTSLLLSLLGELVERAVAPEDDTASPYGGFLQGRVGWVPQEGWVRSQSVKDNIIGPPVIPGDPSAEDRVDEAWYARVVEACCLLPDFAELHQGDATMIGEQGVTLSGGQKARITLARAVYSNPDLYLLDDPLSAVDAHVGHALFENVIGGLLSQRTRILVTHQLQFLPQCDRILVIDGGRVVRDGTYAELVARGVQFPSLLRSNSADSNAMGSSVGDSRVSGDGSVPQRQSLGPRAVSVPVSNAGHHPEPLRTTRSTSAGSVSREQLDDAWMARAESLLRDPEDVFAVGSEEGDDDGLLGIAPLLRRRSSASSSSGRGGDASWKSEASHAPAVPPPEASLVQEEDRYRGAVGAGVYTQYVRLLGPRKFLVTLGLCALGVEAAKIMTANWVNLWASKNQSSLGEVESGDESTPWPVSVWLSVLALLGAVATCLVYVRNVIWFDATLRASNGVHARALRALLRTPFSFFTATPHGRILNRFSKDLLAMDTSLPDVANDTLLAVTELCSRIVAIVIGAPWFLIFVPSIGYMYYRILQLFRASYREMTRIEGITKSPVLSIFTEGVDGVVGIRTFGWFQHDHVLLHHAVDEHSKVRLANAAASAWIGIRTEGMGIATTAAAALLAVLAVSPGIPSIFAADVHFLQLAITLALVSTGSGNWMVKCGTRTEAEMGRVERMLHYASLDPEAPLRGTRKMHPQEALCDRAVVSPPDGWPSGGHVVFDDVWLRYRPDLDSVLRGVSFQVAPGERVGIVGRTGAGKSSTLSALLRIVEAYAGRILIDGVSIAHIGLRDLRESVSVIPQDPVLFRGTIRSALSPAGPETDAAPLEDDSHVVDAPRCPPIRDADMWSILERVGLAEWVRLQPAQLDTAVDAGGGNFSVGQRQLLCLGRALLKRSRILVLDEATACVDPETDQVIQRAIRSATRGTTVLAIAHRLPTIIDYDKILVLAHGRVAEFGAPADLLRNPDGAFHSMVQDTGEESAAFLMRAARRHRGRGGGAGAEPAARGLA